MHQILRPRAEGKIKDTKLFEGIPRPRVEQYDENYTLKCRGQKLRERLAIKII